MALCLRDAAKAFSASGGSAGETKARLRGCLAFDDGVGGGPVLYKVWDAGSNCVTVRRLMGDVHHPPRERDEETERESLPPTSN